MDCGRCDGLAESRLARHASVNDKDTRLLHVYVIQVSLFSHNRSREIS